MAGGAVVGALRVTLGIDTAAFDKGASLAQKKLAATGKRFEAIGSSMSSIGTKMSAGLTLPFIALATTSSKAATESAQAMGQVNAALTSMGNASGRTSEQLAKSAEGLMKISTYDDDEILRKVTANMLTFGKVSGESFDRAQLAAVNLATRLGGDLQGATMMIGKALNDPVKGIAAMSRAGIQFTADQKAMIASMVASGDAAGAQAIMLAELERQFGGSAEAMRKATPGIESKQAWDNFQEIVGKIVNETLPPLTALLTRVLDGFNNLSPGTQSFAVGAAAVVAAVGPAMMGLGPLVGIIGKLIPLIGTTGGAGIVGALGPLALAAGAAYLAFENWEKIKPVVEDFGKVVSATVTALDAKLLGFQESIAGVDKKLGIPPPDVWAKATVAAFTLLGNIASGVVVKIYDGFVHQLPAAFNALKDKAVGAMGAMVTGVRMWLVDKLGAVWNIAKAGIDKVAAAFKWLDNVVVRNSYIPDMVDSIGEHMARLDALMVAPAAKGTKAVADSFKALQAAVQPLLDRLFPEQARHNQFLVDITNLEAGMKKLGYTAEQTAEAIRRLRNENLDAVSGKSEGGPLQAPIGDLKTDFDDALEDKYWGLEKAGIAAGTAAGGLVGALERVQERLGGIGQVGGNVFTDMASDILADVIPAIKVLGDKTATLGDKIMALGQAAASIFGKIFGRKAGNIIGALASAGAAVAGAMGKGPQLQGFANGGSFQVGGVGGIDKNLVQFRASRGEMVNISKPGNDNGGGRSVTNVFKGNLMTPEFWAQVQAGDDSAAMRGAVVGSSMGQAQMARRGRRRLA